MMIRQKSLVLLMMGMLAITGCGEAGSLLPPAVTQITYSISPDKQIYTAGEEIVVTAAATGPKADDTTVGWGFSLSGGTMTSFPQSTAMTYTFNAPIAGTLVVTGEPAQLTVNGVDQFEGSITYTINVE